jgi:hypothetical protein
MDAAGTSVGAGVLEAIKDWPLWLFAISKPHTCCSGFSRSNFYLCHYRRVDIRYRARAKPTIDLVSQYLKRREEGHHFLSRPLCNDVIAAFPNNPTGHTYPIYR